MNIDFVIPEIIRLMRMSLKDNIRVLIAEVHTCMMRYGEENEVKNNTYIGRVEDFEVQKCKYGKKTFGLDIKARFHIKGAMDYIIQDTKDIYDVRIKNDCIAIYSAHDIVRTEFILRIGRYGDNAKENI